MKFEIQMKHSVRIRIVDWQASWFARPRLAIDFNELGQAYPRCKSAADHIWMRTEFSPNVLGGRYYRPILNVDLWNLGLNGVKVGLIMRDGYPISA